MRVVLDTNVLIASFIARGICTDVFERVISDHELILSSYLLDEFQRAMTVKLGLNLERVERAVALLRRKGCIIEPDRLETPVCRDEDDDPILALARSSAAACLVTGDDDLLILTAFENTPIITPRTFLTFEPQRDEG
jgi:putative PIN family toxin of toxin-antitoxin system